MWRHFCQAERGWLMTGAGEPCNWCDEQPQEHEKRKLAGPSVAVGEGAALRARSDANSRAPERPSPTSSWWL